MPWGYCCGGTCGVLWVLQGNFECQVELEGPRSIVSPVGPPQACPNPSSTLCCWYAMGLLLWRDLRSPVGASEEFRVPGRARGSKVNREPCRTSASLSKSLFHPLLLVCHGVIVVAGPAESCGCFRGISSARSSSRVQGQS